MDIKEFIAKYYPDGFYPKGKPLGKRREEFKRRNSQWICNGKKVDVVFFGDSIMEWWEVYAYFSNCGVLVNRGYSGELIRAAVKRFTEDVVDLKPKVAVLFEGTNDLSICHAKAKKKGLSDQEMIELGKGLSKYHEMVMKIAKKNGVKLIACSVLPYGCKDIRNQMIVALNGQIKALSEKYGFEYADFHSAIVKEDGLTMQDVHFGDELHPHVSGYDIMAKVLGPILERQLKD
jgi:lysophospholipase L1-like esterase